MNTFARRFQRNLPHKFSEWICAMVILSCGMLWMTFPENFQRPDMVTFTDIMPPKLWNAVCICAGLYRVVSIAFNGEFVVAGGLMRFTGALMGCTIFGAFLGRAIASGDGSLTFGMLLIAGYIVMDVRNAFRSAADSFNGWRKVSYVAPMVR